MRPCTSMWAWEWVESVWARGRVGAWTRGCVCTQYHYLRERKVRPS